MDASRCADIQRLISAAYDGATPGPEALESAKAHCSGCPECAAFVALLAELRRLPAPEIPEDVLERTLAAVRTEMAAAEAAPEDPVQPAEETPVSPAVTTSVPATAADATEPAVPSRAQWRAWAPWAAAAAVFFIAAGVVTAQGVRYLLRPDAGMMTASDSLSTEQLDDSAERSLPDGAPDGSESEPGEARSAITGPAYVTLSGRVYVYDSALAAPPADAPTGSLTSALDSGGTATQRELYTETGSDAIVVAGDEGSYLRFTPVVRSFRGQEYALQAPMIPAFGLWPSLADGIPRPSSPDGVPELIAAGVDDTGVQVFVRPGTDASSGFAIAPGTPPGDPAAGNPEWTWWEPAGR